MYCFGYSDRREYITAVLAVDCVDSGLDEEQKISPKNTLFLFRYEFGAQVHNIITTYIQAVLRPFQIYSFLCLDNNGRYIYARMAQYRPGQKILVHTRHVHQSGKNNIQHALYTCELPCNNMDLRYDRYNNKIVCYRKQNTRNIRRKNFYDIVILPDVHT